MTVGNQTAYLLWLSTVCFPGSDLPKRAYLAFDGDMRRLYETPSEVLSDYGFSPEECETLGKKDFSRANQITDYCAENGITLLTFESEQYPERLFMLDDPPPVLYAKGQVHRFRPNPTVTAVGSRNCSEAGYRDAYTLCYKLSCAGVSIVTGLAEGIDTACTLAALDSGGFAIGILGSGINMLYPYESRELFSRMMRSGLVLTEFSPYTQPMARNFPIRNRVLAALCDVCLVGEARVGSGALITAADTRSCGKPIYAIPGRIYDEKCEGTNQLLRGGALPATKAQDILEGLSYLYPESNRLYERENGKRPEPKGEAVIKQKPPKSRSKTKEKAKIRSESTVDEIVAEPTVRPKTVDRASLHLEERSEDEKKILLALLDGAKTPDELCRECALSADGILTVLTMLEIEGTITSLPGGTVALVTGEEGTS